MNIEDWKAEAFAAQSVIISREKQIKAIQAQRDELLEALKDLMEYFAIQNEPPFQKQFEAIAHAERKESHE